MTTIYWTLANAHASTRMVINLFQIKFRSCSICVVLNIISDINKSKYVGIRYDTWEQTKTSRGWFNIKTSYQYGKSHCGYKMILRPSYLHNGISYTGKMTYLYWIRALNSLWKYLRTPSWHQHPFKGYKQERQIDFISVLHSAISN